MQLYLGIDLGTSGCRALAIDAQGKVQGQAAVALPAPERHGAGVEQNPELWWQAVHLALKKLFQQIPAQSVMAIAVDGTSGTVLLADKSGLPLGPALMYNDARAVAEAAHIARIAPGQALHTALPGRWPSCFTCRITLARVPATRSARLTGLAHGSAGAMASAMNIIA